MIFCWCGVKSRAIALLPACWSRFQGETDNVPAVAVGYRLDAGRAKILLDLRVVRQLVAVERHVSILDPQSQKLAVERFGFQELVSPPHFIRNAEVFGHPREDPQAGGLAGRLF